jgi:hypothetical protein
MSSKNAPMTLNTAARLYPDNFEEFGEPLSVA